MQKLGFPCAELIKFQAVSVWESKLIASCIMKLGTRWRWVVGFTHRPLYLQGKSRLYPLNGRPVAFY